MIQEMLDKASALTSAWALAYRQAIKDGNEEAISTLEKNAPRLNRAATAAEKIDPKRVVYAAAMDFVKLGPVAVGSDAEIRAHAALRQSYKRKVNAVKRVMSDLNAL